MLRVVLLRGGCYVSRLSSVIGCARLCSCTVDPFSLVRPHVVVSVDLVRARSLI